VIEAAPVETGLTGAVAIAAGGSSTCVVDTLGDVRCWGGNSDGQLGDGTTTSRPTPTLIAGLPGPASSVAVGSATAYALLADGSIFAWGRGDQGQLGNGAESSSAVPVAVSIVSASKVAAGGNFACAVTGADVQCWGGNEFGQLGDGTLTARSVPGLVLFPF
jgi:alpha-tubulin suppressor-like RCC1 family protein